MAILTQNDRKAIAAEFMREDYGSISCTKNDVRTAIDDIDTWIDGARANLNSNISQPARSSLSARQKFAILYLILKYRLNIGAEG